MAGVMSRQGATGPGKKGTVGSTLGQLHIICGWSETSVWQALMFTVVEIFTLFLMESTNQMKLHPVLPVAPFQFSFPTRPVVWWWHRSLYDRCHSQKIFSHTIAMSHDRQRAFWKILELGRWERSNPCNSFDMCKIWTVVMKGLGYTSKSWSRCSQIL